MQTKPAAAYARFSSDNQRAESIDAQFADIDRYAERMGYTVVARYADEAKSATTDRRPEFQRMISDAETGAFAAVLVFKLDRFSRDRYDFAFYRRKLARSGVKIVSINENLSDDPESVIMESVLEGMAEYYSRNLSREVMRKGLLPNAEKCIFNGGTPPLGYDIRDRHYVINPEEAETVRIIFEMYADGLGYDKIIDRCAAENRRGKNGRRLTKSTLYDLLHNERYKGVYIYNAQTSKDSDGRRSRRKMKPDDEIIRIPDGVPRIVSDETFARVQLMFEKRKHLGNNAKREYILSGKLFCGKCGSAMCGRSSNNDGIIYNYYDCAGKKNGHLCRAHSPRADVIEKVVIDAIYNEVLSPEAAETFADKVIAYMDGARQRLPAQLGEIRKVLSDTEKQIAGIVEAVTAGMYSPALNQKMSELESRKEIYLARLHDIERRAATTTASRDDILRYLSTFGDIRQADPHEQRRAVEVFVDKIIVTDGKAEISILSPVGKAEGENASEIGAGLSAPPQREIVLMISRPIQNNTRR